MGGGEENVKYSGFNQEKQFSCSFLHNFVEEINYAEECAFLLRLKKEQVGLREMPGTYMCLLFSCISWQFVVGRMVYPVNFSSEMDSWQERAAGVSSHVRDISFPSCGVGLLQKGLSWYFWGCWGHTEPQWSSSSCVLRQHRLSSLPDLGYVGPFLGINLQDTGTLSEMDEDLSKVGFPLLYWRKTNCSFSFFRVLHNSFQPRDMKQSFSWKRKQARPSTLKIWIP